HTVRAGSRNNPRNASILPLRCRVRSGRSVRTETVMRVTVRRKMTSGRGLTDDGRDSLAGLLLGRLLRFEPGRERLQVLLAALEQLPVLLAVDRLLLEQELSDPVRLALEPDTRQVGRLHLVLGLLFLFAFLLLDLLSQHRVTRIALGFEKD